MRTRAGIALADLRTAMGPVGCRATVRGFGRGLIEATPQASRHTRVARVPELQRTYLLRLIKDLDVTTPARQRSYRRGRSLTWRVARQG